MLRRISGLPGLVFAFVVLWKLLVLLTLGQPVPFSDAFFYDGPVVNLLNGGSYLNPSLALVLPISGTKVFSAYPPLYQAVLWIWMSVFGTAAEAALWLHWVLFVIYGFALLAVLRELGTPARWVNIGCLFLFGITFHDRPDSLALACGFWAIFGWLRAGRTAAPNRPNGWAWLAAALNVMTLATSPQIGLAFLGWSWWLVVMECRRAGRPAPWRSLAASVVVPAVLVLAVRGGAPLLWEGFREHVTQTPTLLGWQTENAVGLFKSQVFKLARTAPGILFAGGCLAWWCGRMGRGDLALLQARGAVFLATTIVAAGCLIFAGTVLLMPSVIQWLAYLQPIVVALTLMWFVRLDIPPRVSLWLPRIFLGLALVVGVRAVGISTWGVACALDSNVRKSVQRVGQAIRDSPRGATVVVSAAFLYEANRHRQERSLHADWLYSYRHPTNLAQRIIEVKPATLVLTQFDWYRRYEPFVAELQRQTNIVHVSVTNTAGVRPPDAFPRLQRILQHISWAPVIVELEWQPNSESQPGERR